MKPILIVGSYLSPYVRKGAGLLASTLRIASRPTVWGEKGDREMVDRTLRE